MFNPHSTDAVISQILTEVKALREDMIRRFNDGENRMDKHDADIQDLRETKAKGGGAWWVLSGVFGLLLAIAEIYALWPKH